MSSGFAKTKRNTVFMCKWPHKTERSSIANFATKFGSGRVILFPRLANPEIEPELVRVRSLSHNKIIVLLHSFS